MVDTRKIPSIIGNDESDEYYFEEGCYIWELSNSDTDSDVSIARARVLPQTETKLHRLASTVERYIILQGQGEVTLGQHNEVELSNHEAHITEMVNIGDVIIIPENCPQSIKNTGLDDLIFLVVCTPRFVVDNYMDITSS